MLYAKMIFVLAATIAAASPRVRIDSGEVVGVAANGVIAFKGIPYAAPPIGDLRWQPPQLPQPWRDARSSEDYGHSCPQHTPPERVAPESQGATTSEDCLTLNVWTTLQSQRLQPVMVWIHGGGNNAGTSAQTYYDGTAFGCDGVVLVSFNYRLGALGFLTHPAIKGANFGLLDQLAALAWVKRNIEAFGGDPNNITVFGESAGGTDILTLMTSRKAAGAFQKAIVESAGWWNHVPRLADGQKAGLAIATKLGLPDATIAQLRAVPVDALKDIDEPGPVIDHDLLTESPQSAFEHGRTHHLPLIIGTNSNEGSLIAADTPAAEGVPELSGADLEQLKLLYQAAPQPAPAVVPHSTASGNSRSTPQGGPPSLPSPESHSTPLGHPLPMVSPESHSTRFVEPPLAPLLFRDAHFSMPARWIAAHEGAPAYLYRFDYVASFLAHRRTAANHGSEIPFVFATWPDFRLNEADQQMTRALHGCWVAFAKTGRPVCPDAPLWPPFSVGSDKWLRRHTEFSAEPAAKVTITGCTPTPTPGDRCDESDARLPDLS